MGFIKNIIIILILIVIVSTATYYLTKGAANIVVKGDPYQKKAEDLLIAASTVGWISIAFILIGGVGLIYYGGAAAVASGEASIIVYGFLTLIIIVFVLNGALAVGAAVNIKKGPDFEKNKSIYNNCAWIGGIFIGVTGLIIIYFIYTYFSSKAAIKKAQEEAIISQYNKVQSVARINDMKKSNSVITNPTSFATLQTLNTLGLPPETINTLNSNGISSNTLDKLIKSGLSPDVLKQLLSSPEALSQLTSIMK